MVENTRVLKNNFVGIILNTQNRRTEHYFWGFEKQTRTKRNRFRNLEKEQKKNILYELVCTVYTSTVHTFIVFLRGRKTITGMIQSNYISLHCTIHCKHLQQSWALTTTFARQCNNGAVIPKNRYRLQCHCTRCCRHRGPNICLTWLLLYELESASQKYLLLFNFNKICIHFLKLLLLEFFVLNLKSD